MCRFEKAKKARRDSILATESADLISSVDQKLFYEREFNL